MPATFELCTELVRPGGRVANVGVHGAPATLHLEKLWIRDVTITTGLVDTSTTPQLLKLIAGGRLDPRLFATHRFALDEVMAAYDMFAAAAETDALKVVLDAGPVALDELSSARPRGRRAPLPHSGARQPMSRRAASSFLPAGSAAAAWAKRAAASPTRGRPDRRAAGRVSRGDECPGGSRRRRKSDESSAHARERAG